jgi:hypothetical protein
MHPIEVGLMAVEIQLLGSSPIVAAGAAARYARDREHF